MANARCMRAAQVQARGVGFTPASSGPAADGAAEAVGSGSTRLYATTRSRHRARGAVLLARRAHRVPDVAQGMLRERKQGHV
jgi:hypothetical protein